MGISKCKNILLFNLFGGHGTHDLSEKSNTWQVKNYEEIAETVYVLFLTGQHPQKIIRNGRTILLSLGSGHTKLDILRAPFILWKLVKKKNINIAITYEQVFLFWINSFIKIFTPIKTYLLPITLPKVMYEITGKSLSLIFPIWFEKILRQWSGYSCNAVLTSNNFGDYKNWLSTDKIFKNKLIILDKVIEEVPSPFFFRKLEEIKKMPTPKSTNLNLLCISRLKKEKLLEDVLNSFAEILKVYPNANLHILGEGDNRNYFENICNALKIQNKVIFYGYLSLIDIVPFYKRCDIYVSTLTGSALREVALYGMPVIAYEMDWVKNSFIDRENYMATTPHSYKELASNALTVYNDAALSQKLSTNINAMAMIQWSHYNLLELYGQIISQ